MKPMRAHFSAGPQDLLGYKVVDPSGSLIGTVHGRWADPATGTLKFLGVNTVEPSVSNHLVPAEAAEIDEDGRVIQVPFHAGFVRAAPGLETGAHLLPEREAEILQHYAGSLDTGSVTVPAAGAEPAGPRAGDDTVELALAEEQLKVSKRTVPAGMVRVRKIVVTEQVQVPVEVRREEVVIERVERGEAIGADDVPFDGKTVELVLYEEKAVVSKEVHVSGAVRVRRIVEVEHGTVREAVRRQDVEVLRAGETGGWHQDKALASTPVPALVQQQQQQRSADPLPGPNPAASVAAASNPAAVPEGSQSAGSEHREGTGHV
jgi:uncharacterized protein (TIGR02271 family)